MNEPILAGRAIAPGEGHAAGRALLEELYRAHFGEKMPPVAVSPRGKPYFCAGSCHFSITHTDRHVFCALYDAPISIDAEEADRRLDPRLARRVLSAAEYARYLAAPDRSAALLRLWVLKEADCKRTGEGLRGFPNTTDFAPDDPRVTVRDGCVLAVIKEGDNV